MITLETICTAIYALNAAIRAERQLVEAGEHLGFDLGRMERARLALRNERDRLEALDRIQACTRRAA